MVNITPPYTPTKLSIFIIYLFSIFLKDGPDWIVLFIVFNVYRKIYEIGLKKRKYPESG